MPVYSRIVLMLLFLTVCLIGCGQEYDKDYLHGAWKAVRVDEIEKVENWNFDFYLKGVHLHSDIGGPMEGLSLLALLYRIGVRYLFNRPRVSNDNPFIESFFRTLKYSTGYPGRFRNIDHDRQWMADFINWYNDRHLQSALGYITPMEKRSGRDIELFRKLNFIMEAARDSRPERWGNRSAKEWIPSKVVVLNPETNYEEPSPRRR